MRDFLRRGERGQAIWWILLIFPLFLIGAAITIDASIWYGHRRVYQKTADASALAGAQELLSRTNSADMTARATLNAEEWMTRNNRPPAEFEPGYPEVVNDCWWGIPSFDGLPDGVIVDVSKEAPLLFIRAFGVSPFDIGAHARVCLGSPQEAKGMLPFGIPIDVSECFDEDGGPLFGSPCDIAIRVPEGESGEAQYLTLWDSDSEDPALWSRRCSDANAQISKDDYVAQVTRGARTWCRVAHSDETCPAEPAPDDTGYCVYSKTGNRAKWALEGLQNRLLNEGDSDPPHNCDAQYASNPAWQSYPYEEPGTVGEGIDQWWEALEPTAGGDWPPEPTGDVTFVRRDCTAPRLVTLILIDQYEPQGNPPYPIRGFAAFFIEGCHDEDAVFDAYCRTKQADGPLSNTGHLYMEGTFINYVDIGGPGGPATPYGRMQLYLVE